MDLLIDRRIENLEYTRVTKRLRDHRRNPVGTSNYNPTLDTRMCEVEYFCG